MTRTEAPGLRQEVLAEASHWFVELNEHPEDEAARREFDRWLRRSPEHVQAFLQISAHWEENAARPDAPVESVDALVALARSASNVVHFAPADQVQTRMRASNTAKTRPVARRISVAACVLLGVMGALVWQQFFRGTHSTRVGEQRSLTLADGSVVELNSRTRIRVRYDAHERRVELLEGQALFHVAKNDAQPFIVRSRNTQVRAVGTQFDVYRKATGTVVTVVEGRVAVMPLARKSEREEAGESARDGTTATPSLLDAGQQITLALDVALPTAPARLEPAEMEAAMAWTQRRLIFKGTPLAEVADEFNRYNERRIVIVDADIAAIPISGSFSSSDSADFVRFLREVAAYNVHETSSTLEISRK